MDERQNIVNNLTIAQEDLHKDAYVADYPDTDDDMPDAFEG
jgi:hypothetical protein